MLATPPASRADAPHVIAYDDDPALLRIYGELLGDAGYRVTLVRGDRGAPAPRSALQPDLIIVDLLHGHVARGLAVLAALRGHGAAGMPAVLVCSGNTKLLEDVSPQLRAWGWGVVAKPFDIEDFLAEVRGCLDRAVGSRSMAGRLRAVA